jgi:hypothetical protein
MHKKVDRKTRIENFTYMREPYSEVKCVALLVHIREVPGLNLGPENGYLN